MKYRFDSATDSPDSVSEPHFDDERTVLSARPVVPLEKINAKSRHPVVMLANSEREITRALDLGAEFKLKLIIAGGREADQVADRLAKQNVPVLLSLNLPRRTTAALPEADPSRTCAS